VALKPRWIFLIGRVEASPDDKLDVFMVEVEWSLDCLSWNGFPQVQSLAIILCNTTWVGRHLPKDNLTIKA